MNTEKLNFVMDALETLRIKMKEFDTFIDTVGLDYEGTLCSNVFHTYDSLVDSLSMLIDDKDEWISFFIYDCDWGQRSKDVVINGKPYEIETLEDLRTILNVIYA